MTPSSPHGTRSPEPFVWTATVERIVEKLTHCRQTLETINNPKDFYVTKAVDQLAHLRDLGDQVNRKLLDVERVSHHCVLTQDALDRLQQPTCAGCG